MLTDMSTVLAPSPTLRPRASPIAAARASRHLDSCVIAAILFAGYAAVSLRRHHLLLTSGYDLGIFEQSVRSWANGQWPTSRLKGVAYPVLGDHFSPIVAVLAPVYRLFPSPITLLVAQAALLALGVVPLHRFARERMGAGTAAVVAFTYAGSLGLLDALTFDFHEIAFAIPLLSCALVACAAERSRAALLWALPVLLVKEDLGITIAALALLIAVRDRRARGLGLGVAAFALSWTVIVMIVVIPAVNPGRRNAYTHQLTTELFNHDDLRVKLTTTLILLGASAFGAIHSPLSLVAVPTLAWRFVSDNPAYWGTGYHYDAVPAVVLAVAFADALNRGAFAGRTGRTVQGAAVAVAGLSVAATPVAPALTPGFWSDPPSVTQTRALLQGIPDGARVSASNWLAPQLTDRAEVSLFGAEGVPVADYVAVDLGHTGFPIGRGATQRLLQECTASGFSIADHRGDVWLLRRLP